MKTKQILAIFIALMASYALQAQTYGSFTDTRDGKTYKTVKIGEQVWMAENLAYLPSVVGPATGDETTAYYYVYGYDGTDVNVAKATVNYTTYGVLYNGPAALNGAGNSSSNPSGVKGICPAGWHLPSVKEWSQLAVFVGGFHQASRKLKEVGTTHWNTTDSETTNETGFTALPGGERENGSFAYIGESGVWWTTDAGGVMGGKKVSMIDWQSNVNYNTTSSYIRGHSVRCIKN